MTAKYMSVRGKKPANLGAGGQFAMAAVRVTSSATPPQYQESS